ncbi:hypothetical protein BDF14DRAFT_1222232 [Spinellus fusiger]|nr:hypothetical protein BDF14DRAFT_1222232 [Spinellus fusiger]
MLFYLFNDIQRFNYKKLLEILFLLISFFNIYKNIHLKIAIAFSRYFEYGIFKAFIFRTLIQTVINFITQYIIHLYFLPMINIYS